jgi:hypothetical protein
MSKRLVHMLEGLVDAAFKDVAYTYTRVSDWERDRNRSLHELARRGLRFLTIDVPAIRKHLDKCLGVSLYTPSGLYLCGRVSKRIVVPAFGRDLYLQIFTVDGKLRDDANPSAVSDLRQLYDTLGKLKVQCEERYINDEVNNFITNELELRSPTLNWEADQLVDLSLSLRKCHFSDGNSRNCDDIGFLQNDGESISISSADAAAVQYVCDRLSSAFGDLHDESRGRSLKVPKHGPGRVSNLPRGKSKSDFHFWPAKLDGIFPFDLYATHNLGYDSIEGDGVLTYVNHEHPSKLIAVPKTATGPRLIGSEPNYYQWCQQLIRSQLEEIVKSTPLRHSITFGDQRPNRKLALEGSITGALATVDLKSASDRLSCWTIERAFRANETLIERIHSTRTRTMTNSVNNAFGTIKLRKCFTQGSACTFPVQTIVYSMLCVAAVLISRREKLTTKNINAACRKVRVFGDDLIIPSDALVKLTEILSFVQLKVNLAKTFHQGRFRESCGLDVFDGVDVTPARIKRLSINPSHEELQSLIEASNNLHKRGMWHMSEWIRTTFLGNIELPIRKLHECQLDPQNPLPDREKGIPDIPEMEDTGGLQSFVGDRFSHLRQRWNSNLHRHEMRSHKLVSKTRLRTSDTANDLLEYFVQGRRAPSGLDHLFPLLGGIGIVDKKASVMKRGWGPVPEVSIPHLL